MKLATSAHAQRVWDLVQKLQLKFQQELVLSDHTNATKFSQHDWLRDEGSCGGGWRRVAEQGKMFNRATINISQVQYEAYPQKPLISATALSTIIHPHNPLIPSTHMHFSWTEVRSGSHYWRVMADLNPSHPFEQDKSIYLAAMKNLSGQFFDEGVKQGDKYFYIPELERTRGVAHFYLEQFATADCDKDFDFVKNFAEGMIDCYIAIFRDALQSRSLYDAQNEAFQKAYHTLYFFQVLMLDRGTTSGLLAHQQNDLGILGSLPTHVDRGLLQSWTVRVQGERRQLLQSMIDVVGESGAVTDEVKLQLIAVIRAFYKKYPHAISEQASGFVIPPTIVNHLGK